MEELNVNYMIWTKYDGEYVWIHVISYDKDQGVESHEWNGRIKNIKKSVEDKVALKEKISPNVFSNAIDFFRINTNSTDKIYHHIGIYCYDIQTLKGGRLWHTLYME